MTKKYVDLRAKMRAESRARVDAQVRRTLEQMLPEELRNAGEMTQMQLIEALWVSDGAGSEVEP